jgi:replicative DNA helicase
MNRAARPPAVRRWRPPRPAGSSGVAKQRNGPTGKVPVRFLASCTRFDNLEPGDVPEGFHDD